MSEKRGRGRPRNPEADLEILRAAAGLLRERGYRDLTVDAVAERTGITKTMIYRRWPTKAALVAAALETEGRASTADGIVAEARELIGALGPIEGEVTDVLRAILAPRRVRLVEATGDADAADAVLARLLLETILGR